ncbi:hypothetical protein RCL1_001614 [Eukaryota sp. TZLM3-RCL]
MANPGVINATNYRSFEELIPFSNPLDDSSCTDCKVPKVARSRHCKYCKQCIARYDHHCFFVGCIGVGNVLYFLLFIFSISLHCLITFLLSFSHLRTINHLTGKVVELSAASSLPSIQQVFSEKIDLLQLSVRLLKIYSLAFVLFFTLFSIYFCFHLSLLCNDTTSYELKKYSNKLGKSRRTSKDTSLFKSLYVAWKLQQQSRLLS